MSESFAVVLVWTELGRPGVEAFGPFDEDEADALAAKLRTVYDSADDQRVRARGRRGANPLDPSVNVVLLRGWTERRR